VPNNYPPEFRRQMVELVRAGRSPEELAKEFEPSAQSIRTWVRQADLNEGRRNDGLTTAEREELARLRRENKILREEKEILRRPRLSSRGRRICRDEVPADPCGERPP
jgi:transposase